MKAISTRDKLLFVVSFFLIIGCGKKIQPVIVEFDDFSKKTRNEVIIEFDKFVDECKLNRVSKKYLSLVENSEFELDSFLLFNYGHNKCYTTLNRKGKHYHTSDGINEVYGKKIDGGWYFIIGSHLVTPRRFYQFNSYEPMTFEELSYLAHDMRHKHYLKKSDNGKDIVDHEKIERMVSSENLIWGEDWIEYYNRKMSDTLSTQELKQYEINKAKAEAEFVPKQFPKPKKTPIFETEAWKNRNKKKNKN